MLFRSSPQFAPAHRAITPETIAAYEKLGAEYGGFNVNRFGVIVFTTGQQAATHGLPAFRFGDVKHGKLIKFPAVPIPFGLDLGHPKVTDAQIKQLKNLTNLAMIDLFGAKITDEGLSEIKDLKGLTYLNLGDTQVTDRGLKELKNLTSITHLDLRGVVTDDGLKHLRPDRKSVV